MNVDGVPLAFTRPLSVAEPVTGFPATAVMSVAGSVTTVGGPLRNGVPSSTRRRMLSKYVRIVNCAADRTPDLKWLMISMRYVRPTMTTPLGRPSLRRPEKPAPQLLGSDWPTFGRRSRHSSWRVLLPWSTRFIVNVFSPPMSSRPSKTAQMSNWKVALSGVPAALTGLAPPPIVNGEDWATAVPSMSDSRSAVLTAFCSSEPAGVPTLGAWVVLVAQTGVGSPMPISVQLLDTVA